MITIHVLRVPLTLVSCSSSTTFILLPDNANENFLVLENLSDCPQMEGSEGLLYQKHEEEGWIIDGWRCASESRKMKVSASSLR